MARALWTFLAAVLLAILAESLPVDDTKLAVTPDSKNSGSALINQMTVCPISIPLPNGAKMPALGLGTFQAINEDDLIKALEKALEVGYRHIDTATVYRNEKIIGKVLKKWIDAGKIKREDLFIVTKLPSVGNRQSAVEKFLKQSLQDLQLDYIDLYLIHTPVGLQDTGTGELQTRGPDGKVLLDKTTDLVGIWKGMEAQVYAGRAKAIGLSNFNEKQIQRIIDAAEIKPANLQVEIHAYFQQRPLVEFCHKNDISVVAYAPLGSPGTKQFMEKHGQKYNVPDVLNNETVLSIAKKHNKLPAHVLIRHLLQRGIATIPKSTNPERVASNFQVFDFELDQSDMEALNKLDQGPSGRAFTFAFGTEDHPERPY